MGRGLTEPGLRKLGSGFGDGRSSILIGDGRVRQWWLQEVRFCGEASPHQEIRALVLERRCDTSVWGQGSTGESVLGKDKKKENNGAFDLISICPVDLHSYGIEIQLEGVVFLLIASKRVVWAIFPSLIQSIRC